MHEFLITECHSSQSGYVQKIYMLMTAYKSWHFCDISRQVTPCIISFNILLVDDREWINALHKCWRDPSWHGIEKFFKYLTAFIFLIKLDDFLMSPHFSVRWDEILPSIKETFFVAKARIQTNFTFPSSFLFHFLAWVTDWKSLQRKFHSLSLSYWKRRHG